MTPECPDLERCADLERFVRGEIDAAAFPHREHVRMAFEMLRRHDFAESVWLYSRALRAMTAKAGKPQAFHQTMTIAFLSLIAERMDQGGPQEFAAFEKANPDLLTRGALAQWYRPERLATELARRTFVLPEPPRDGSP
jgi:hypothetical protein